LKIPKPRNILPCLAKPDSAPEPIRVAIHPCIALISANGLHFNMKQKENKFFTTTLYKIDRVLEDKRFLKDDPNNIDLLRSRLPPVYQEYWDVFSKVAADQLSEH
ncbi:hypothetical protein EJ02DRAFT_258495, partial [Clathrospora elynae]